MTKIVSQTKTPIAIFDSGYGGLTVLERIRALLPEYDYIYLGDNARNPYGTRSFDIVYQYTLQAVRKLIDMGAPLTILACNTASAKALRTIQQNDLPRINSSLRVLGVIRPSVEAIGHLTKTKHVGIFGTPGTINSQSFPIEIAKLWDEIKVFQQACPMWVPLIESGEHLNDGADYFVEKYLTELLTRDPLIDTIILGCTHYPLLREVVQKVMGDGVQLVNPAVETARELKYLLEEQHLLSDRVVTGEAPEHWFFVSDGEEKFRKFAASILPSAMLRTEDIGVKTFE